MKVQEVILDNGSKRYMLLDELGTPVLPVMRYIKYLDTTNKSHNTQKTYCYSLKQYFMFIEQQKLDYKMIRLEDLVEFVAWLRNPYENVKATPLHPTKARKTESTINLILTAVTGFYGYLYRNEEIDKPMVDIVMKQVFTGGRNNYKDFLFHVNKGKRANNNILKIKNRKKKIRVLSKEEVEKLICNK